MVPQVWGALLTTDPLEYNREVDDTLELDEVLKPNAALTEILSDLDRTRVKPWILTNAYITHAKRVLKLLDVEPYFDGMIIGGLSVLLMQGSRTVIMDKSFLLANRKLECIKKQ